MNSDMEQNSIKYCTGYFVTKIRLLFYDSKLKYFPCVTVILNVLRCN
jgi:hypothetical protein